MISVFACSNPETEKETTVTSATNKDTVNTSLQEETKAIWKYVFDSTLNDFKPVQQRSVSKVDLSPQHIEKIINKNWPNVQIRYNRTSHDTIYISIPNSTVLTQQMGTTGALQFLVSTTYTFTELNDIQHVAFDFEEGDHAIPGVYDRNSWGQLPSAIQ